MKVVLIDSGVVVVCNIHEYDYNNIQFSIESSENMRSTIL